MIKAVIFDMDGTLIDSEPKYWDAWRAMFSPHGLTLSDDDLRAYMGWKSVDVARDLIAKADVVGDPVAFTDRLVDEMISLLPPDVLPGAESAILLAREVGHRVALATSAGERLASATLASLGFTKYFDVVVSAENKRFGKPHPDVFIDTADALGVLPEECVVIEDAPNGVLAAKAAKMRCICVPETSTRNVPTIAIADHVLTSLTDLRIDHLA